MTYGQYKKHQEMTWASNFNATNPFDMQYIYSILYIIQIGAHSFMPYTYSKV